jgi:predicted glycosyltransferase
MEDSGNMEQIVLYRPFTKVIITPDILPEKLGKKQIRYKSYHEIAYLHPNYFKPDDTIYEYLRISKSVKFCILRFVSWNATHDFGNKGIPKDDIVTIIKLLSKHFRIFISSESELSADLHEYKISIPPERMHDALFYASLFVGEGATMASESGVLGTTAVYINSIRRSYCEDQEKFGLVYNFQDSKKAIFKIRDLVSHAEKLVNQKESRKSLLKEKIDLTAFLVWFIEKYPLSASIMKNNPDYQFKFR